MKSLNFRILLALAAGERHGWALVRELQARDSEERILPANFYRTLRGMLADGLIEVAVAGITLAGDNISRHPPRRRDDPAAKQDPADRGVTFQGTAQRLAYGNQC